MAINVTGSFLMGAFVALFASRWELPQAWRLFMTVGICGGYTTFSTFALDAYNLASRDAGVAAIAYMGVSVFLSVAALSAAMFLIRSLPS